VKPAPPLFWHAGLLLQQQHFQQLERHFWQSLLPRFALLQPCFWGVRGLELNASALDEQVVELQAGEFLFPDGTLVRLPGDARLAPRSFAQAWADPDRPFKVYVGLRRLQEEGPNVSLAEPSGPEAATRFVCAAQTREVPDLHQEGPTAPVRTLEHALRLFWEPELPELGEFQLLPVLLLENHRGVARRSRSFVPPALQVGDAEDLVRILRALADQVQGYCRNLEAYKGAPEGEGAAAGLAALRVLASHAPRLHHFQATPWLHPRELDLELRQLVGELSTFSGRVNVLGRLPEGRSLLGEYDHNDPLPGFLELQTLIGELLEAILVGPQLVLDLARSGACFQAVLPREVLDSASELFLVVRCPGPEGGEDLEKLAKLGSPGRIPTLVARALSGVVLHRRAVPPPGLPMRPDDRFFWIDRQDPQWQEAQRAQNLCLFWDSAPEGARAELVLVRR